MSLSRKYRPANFKDVIGQDHVVKTLQAALAQGQAAHAYLFSGIQGVGKTTVARLLAKTVNCLHPTGAGQSGRPQKKKTNPRLAEPCNDCANCRAFQAGRFLDVVELDAASNRGVEEIEEVIRSVYFPPQLGRYKVYIIDEVHMLTRHAFNALLKTLEEPPGHIIFVLATTEPHKVLPTIISRCQWFAFRKVGAEEIKQRLGWLAEQEGYKVAPEALQAVALLARGSARDAESVLGKVLSLARPGETLNRERVGELLGFVEVKMIKEFLGHTFRNEAKKAYQVLARASQAGKDMKLFADEAIQYLRRTMLANIDKLLLMGENITKEEARMIVTDARQYSNQQLMKAVEHFLKAREDTYLYPAPQLALEIAVIKIGEELTANSPRKQ